MSDKKETPKQAARRHQELSKVLDGDDSEQKPRAWWINPPEYHHINVLQVVDKRPIHPDFVHVIEHSAYEAVVWERSLASSLASELRAIADAHAADAMCARGEMRTLVQENERLKNEMKRQDGLAVELDSHWQKELTASQARCAGLLEVLENLNIGYACCGSANDAQREALRKFK